MLKLTDRCYPPVQLAERAREALDEASLNDLISLLLSPQLDSGRVWDRVIGDLHHLLDEPRSYHREPILGRYKPIDYSSQGLSQDLFIPSRQVRVTRYSEYLTSEYQRIDRYAQFINQLAPEVMLRIEDYGFDGLRCLYVTQDASMSIPLFEYLERQPSKRLELSEAIEMTRSVARCCQALLSAEPPELIFSPQYIHITPKPRAGSALLDGNMIIYPLVKAIEDQRIAVRMFERFDLLNCFYPDDNDHDESVLVYRLGVVLYRSLCGDFMTHSEPGIILKAINFAREPKPKLSADVLRDAPDDVTLNNLNDLIAWITSGDPEGRPKTLQLLIDALSEFEEMMKRGFSSPDDVWELQHQHAQKIPKRQRSSRSLFRRLFGWMT